MTNSVAKAVIRDSLISGNVAETVGAALQSWKEDSLFDLTNVTTTGNHSRGSQWASAIQMGRTGRLIARNCIVWGNGSSFSGERISCIWSNSLIEGCGGSENWNSHFRTDGGGNLDLNPGFLVPLDDQSGPSLEGDFRIGLDSPAAGMGDQNATDSTKDLAGSSRVMGSGIEMGAYEIIEEIPVTEEPEQESGRKWPLAVSGGVIAFGVCFWFLGRRQTARKRQEIIRMQEEFERIQKRQQSFASETSHELRTPIAVILSHCELALAEGRDPEQIKEAVEACQRAGVRMKNLTDDLLEISKMEDEAVVLEFEPCSLREVTDDALDLVESVAARKGVELNDDVDDIGLVANGDRLWQVVVNLLNNAVRHTPEGNAVFLKGKEEGGKILLSVTDQGEGIPEEEIPNLFRKFHKGESGESGLGLAICETIVTAHQGSLTVTSKPGIETTFLVTLPKDQG